MKVIEKNILTVEKGIICQSVNCQGVMGSGLAKAIREKWPIVYEEYVKFCKFTDNDWGLLGRFLRTQVDKDLHIVNIFGQLSFGYDGKRYTDYGALKTAFSDLEEIYANNFSDDMKIYFPMDFGCCRGGADWKIISKMIEFYFPNAIICRLT